LVVEAYCRAAYITYGLKPKRNRKAATKLYEKALEEFAALKESGQPMGQSKLYAARAAFDLAEFLYMDFKAIKLTVKTLGRGSIRKKMNKLKEIYLAKQAAHDAVGLALVNIGDFKEPQWTASANFRLALTFYDFKQWLLDAPPLGDDFDPEGLDAYYAYLEETAAPFEEQALKWFANAIQFAHQKQVYNHWTKQAAEYAAKVNPDDFPVAEEKEVAHDHTLDTLGSASLITDVKRGEISINMAPEREAPATTP